MPTLCCKHINIIKIYVLRIFYKYIPHNNKDFAGYCNLHFYLTLFAYSSLMITESIEKTSLFLACTP